MNSEGMPSADKKLPENYFRATITILRWTGIELVHEESAWYSIFSKIILFTIVYSYTCVEAFELYANWGDLNAVTTVLNYLVTHIIGAIKITDMYLHRKRFKSIMKRIHEGLFRPDSNRGGPEEGEAIKAVIRKTEIQLLIFGVMVGLVVLGAVIESLKIRITEPQDKWHLAFLNISFIDTSTSPAYEMAYIYQVFCVVAVAAQIMATDVARTSLMAHLSVQLRILQHSLKNIRKRAEVLQKSPRGDGRSLDNCFEDVMRESIEHHLIIFDFAKETELLCSPVVLVIMLSTVMQLCFLLYETSMVPLQSVVFMQYFAYWVDIAYQTIQYCYWGNEVTLEAVGVARGAAESDWPGAPLSVSKSLVLIIARSQKPLHLTAAKFVPLSMPIFMNIVKGSFSYFMVLRQMNEAKGTNN